MASLTAQVLRAAREQVAADSKVLRMGENGTKVIVDAPLAALVTDAGLCQALHLCPEDILGDTQVYQALAIHFIFDQGAHVRKVRLQRRSRREELPHEPRMKITCECLHVVCRSLGIRTGEIWSPRRSSSVLPRKRHCKY
jgi:hypothetical protein